MKSRFVFLVFNVFACYIIIRRQLQGLVLWIQGPHSARLVRVVDDPMTWCSYYRVCVVVLPGL